MRGLIFGLLDAQSLLWHTKLRHVCTRHSLFYSFIKKHAYELLTFLWTSRWIHDRISRWKSCLSIKD
jgi:hypothetical protein